MSSLINYLRQRTKLYEFLKKIYGKTIGLYWLKKLYVEKIGFWNGKKRVKLIKDSKANKILTSKIKKGEPFMVARFGSSELRGVFKDDFDTLYYFAGFFPKDRKLLGKFKKVYMDGSNQIDYLCVWNYLNHFLKKRELMKNLPNIDYFFGKIGGHKQKWIKSLEGKKVLIVHPFKKTIEEQYKKRAKLKILPKFKKLEVIQAIQTLGDNKDERFETWFDALNYLKKEIDKKDFDVALLGCGAYGLPLAAYIKQRGKQAIHVGGSLQLFFGIRGKRWDKSIEYNKYWVSPSKEDFPKDYKRFEGGCYW